MTQHTQEPWIVCEKLSGSENHKGYTIRTNDGWAIASVNPLDEDGVGGLANANRIVNCVQACAGMADPVKAIVALRAECDGWRERQIWHQQVLRPTGGGNRQFEAAGNTALIAATNAALGGEP